MCCPNVVHRDGREASRVKNADRYTMDTTYIYLYEYCQFDGQTETLKIELILANQKFCVINMR